MPSEDPILPAETARHSDHLGTEEGMVSVEQRLEDLSRFFAFAEEEVRRFKGWRSDWLESVPKAGLADLHAARTELQEILDEIPVSQARLRTRLSSEDWDHSVEASGHSVDLREELLARNGSGAVGEGACSIPESVSTRRALHAFAHGEGEHAREILAHLAGMGERIESLIELHARHLVILEEAMGHALAMDGGEAQSAMLKLYLDRFSDIDYDSVRVAHGNALMGSIEDLLEGFDDPDGFDELDDRYDLENPNDSLFRKTVKWTRVILILLTETPLGRVILGVLLAAIAAVIYFVMR
jgi:hypothetical protein